MIKGTFGAKRQSWKRHENTDDTFTTPCNENVTVYNLMPYMT